MAIFWKLILGGWDDLINMDSISKALSLLFPQVSPRTAEVVTWGSPHYGGDSSTVKEQLVGVQQIRGNTGAFAAILEDGTAVVWGHMGHGADAKAIEDQLLFEQLVGFAT